MRKGKSRITDTLIHGSSPLICNSFITHSDQFGPKRRCGNTLFLRCETKMEKIIQFTLVQRNNHYICSTIPHGMHVLLCTYIVAFLFSQRNLANFTTNSRRAKNCDLRLKQAWIVFCFLLGFARTSLTTKTSHAFFVRLSGEKNE